MSLQGNSVAAALAETLCRDLLFLTLIRRIIGLSNYMPGRVLHSIYTLSFDGTDCHLPPAIDLNSVIIMVTQAS